MLILIGRGKCIRLLTPDSVLYKLEKIYCLWFIPNVKLCYKKCLQTKVLIKVCRKYICNKITFMLHSQNKGEMYTCTLDYGIHVSRFGEKIRCKQIQNIIRSNYGRRSTGNERRTEISGTRCI